MDHTLYFFTSGRYEVFNNGFDLTLEALAKLIWRLRESGSPVTVVAFFVMVEQGAASIQDVLLLFIYLELGAMVGIYFKTKHMPTRFLIYVGITVLTRMLIGDVEAHHEPSIGIVYITGSILLLAVANLVVRFGSHRYPSSMPGPGRQTEEK